MCNHSVLTLKNLNISFYEVIFKFLNVRFISFG